MEDGRGFFDMLIHLESNRKSTNTIHQYEMTFHFRKKLDVWQRENAKRIFFLEVSLLCV